MPIIVDDVMIDEYLKAIFICTKLTSILTKSVVILDPINNGFSEKNPDKTTVKIMILSRYRPVTVPLPFSGHRD